MRLIHDRYTLTAAAVMLIIALVCVTGLGEPSEEAVHTGIASDVKRTENGRTFILTDPSGNTMRCFYAGEVEDGDVCSVTGRHSDDRTIFFVSRLHVR